MALVATFTCLRCKKERNEVVDDYGGGICSDCRSKEASRARRTHLASLKGLTVKERIERIEEQLYDADANSRISALESQNARY